MPLPKTLEHLFPPCPTPPPELSKEQIDHLWARSRVQGLLPYKFDRPVSVLNLSEEIISCSQAELLAKGNKYIPKPPFQSRTESVQKALNAFQTRLFRTDFFSRVRRKFKRNRELLPYDPRQIRNRFKDPSEWTPAPSMVSPHTKKQMRHLRRKLETWANEEDLKAGQRPQSTPTKLRQMTKWGLNDFKARRRLDMGPAPPAGPLPVGGLVQPLPTITQEDVDLAHLSQLRSTFKVVFRSADKGSSMVIMSPEGYLFEAQKHFSVDKHYQYLGPQTENFPVSKHGWDRARKAINVLVEHKILNKDQAEYITRSFRNDAQPRRLYFLPKIHKKAAKWTIPYVQPPCRPITSDVGTDTENVALLVDCLIEPLSGGHSSYVKDTPHLLEILSNTHVEEDNLLVTIDVTALYTNVDNQAARKALSELWLSRAHSPDLEMPVLQATLQLLYVCTELNDFTFNGHSYLQKSGFPMGRRFAPRMADLFLDWLETSFLKALPRHLQPKVYLRYLDDIFMIWPHERGFIQDFMDIFNSQHPDINLTHEIHQVSVDFLDVTIFKGPNMVNNRLDTKVYFKPTHSLELLHYSSFHPPHVFKGVVLSQFLRFKRNCSVPGDDLPVQQRLATVLTSKRGYPPALITEATRKLAERSVEKGFFPCNSRDCTICQIHKRNGRGLEPSPYVLRPFGIYDIESHITCATSGVVYLLTCNKCSAKYIGQTTRPLRERFKEHLKNATYPLAPSYAPTPPPQGNDDSESSDSEDVGYHVPPPQESVPDPDDPRSIHFNTSRLYAHKHHLHQFTMIGLYHRPYSGDGHADRQHLLMQEAIFIKMFFSHYSYEDGLNVRAPLVTNMPFVLRYTDLSERCASYLHTWKKRLLYKAPHLLGANIFLSHSNNTPLSHHVSRALVPPNKVIGPGTNPQSTNELATPLGPGCLPHTPELHSSPLSPSLLSSQPRAGPP